MSVRNRKERGSAAGQVELERRFEALIFDWDGTAVPDRKADASALCQLVEEASAVGIHLAIVTGTHAGNVTAQLQVRPAGPGRLMLAVNRGSELFRLTADGPLLVQRRSATAQEDAALTRAAELTVQRLGARGLSTAIVGERLNRRKIDLIPLPEWSDPPKARITELLSAVQSRLAAVGIEGLREAAAVALGAAADAGLAEARVTSDAKHLEVGLTDKSDSARALMRWLWREGVAPVQVLIAGDEWGQLGGLPGSDSLLRTDERASAVSVGAEPAGVPEGVIHLGGGPERFAALLAEQIERRRRGEPPLADVDPEWTLCLRKQPALLARVAESLLCISDGRVGTRGSTILPLPQERPGVRCSGIYAGTGPATHLQPAPLWNTLSLANPPGAADVVRTLDLHGGLLTQELKGGKGELRVALLSLRDRPGTTLMRAHARGLQRSADAPALQPPDHDEEESREIALGVEADLEWVRSGDVKGSVIALAHEQTHAGEAQTWALDRTTVYVGKQDILAEPKDARRGLNRARSLGFEALLDGHRRAWAALWEDADVRVLGDRDLQLAVRFALFHLLAAASAGNESAIGARGLTGAAYSGHVFWDTDVFVLPFLAAAWPRAARAVLGYRAARLPAALRAARALGRAGARFPWESAGSGEDVTPTAARAADGHEVAIWTGAQEEHIVADVAWAAAHYIDWSADWRFADGPGRALIVGCARWWASRIERDRDGRGHIRGVIGPDEYHETVADNAYTNVMARWNLRSAAQRAGGEVADEEARSWLELADSLVDGYQAGSGLYEQFEGFFALEPLVIAKLAKSRPVAADVMLGAERTRGAQVLKQADVLMLHYLNPEATAPASLEPNLAFYEPRTAHGSTLSPGVHATLFARARESDAALRLLRLSARIDLDDIGQTTAGGLHLAAMGAIWRAIVYGFGGLHARPRKRSHGSIASRRRGVLLSLDPVAPGELERIEFGVRFRGARVRVRIGQERTTVSSVPARRMLLPERGEVLVGAKERELPTAPARKARPAAATLACGRSEQDGHGGGGAVGARR
jgi:trehalose/maltose hydrolase-like predicted phosphorylase